MRRVEALSELGFIGPGPEIVQACTEALKDPEESVRGEAIQSLETLGDPAAVAALRKIAEKDPSQDLREEAAEALEELESVARPQDEESQRIHTQPTATALDFEPALLVRGKRTLKLQTSNYTDLRDYS